MKANWPFIGNKEIGLRFRHDLERDLLPVAACLFGPHGVGKSLAVEWSIQAALCTDQAKPCGNCADCRRFLRHEHERCWFVVADGTIGVDDMREILSHFAYAQTERQWLVIPQAERLTESAQNILLKFLEEPPTSVRIIMTCQHPQRLLPTVRSRMAAWFWKRVSDAEMRAAFPSVDRDDIESADGRPAALERIVADTERVHDRIAATQAVKNSLLQKPVIAPRAEDAIERQLTSELQVLRTLLHEVVGLRSSDLTASISVSIGDVIDRIRRHLSLEQPEYANSSLGTKYAYLHLR